MIKQDKEGKWSQVDTVLTLTDKMKEQGWYNTESGDTLLDDIGEGKQFMIADVQCGDEYIAYELYYGSKMDGFEFDDSFTTLEEACNAGVAGIV